MARAPILTKRGAIPVYVAFIKLDCKFSLISCFGRVFLVVVVHSFITRWTRSSLAFEKMLARSFYCWTNPWSLMAAWLARLLARLARNSLLAPTARRRRTRDSSYSQLSSCSSASSSWQHFLMKTKSNTYCIVPYTLSYIILNHPTNWKGRAKKGEN